MGGTLGGYEDFTLKTQLLLRAYPWRRVDPVPWTPLRKPVAASRVALVSSAGLTARGQEPFDKKTLGGDWSYRRVPDTTPVATLRDSHRSKSFDHDPLTEDHNLAFPIDRLRELVAAGRVGSAAPEHLSFMGYISAPGRLIRQSAPEAAEVLVAAQVDLALFVPV